MDKTTVVLGVTAGLALLGLGASAAYENHQVNKKVGKSLEEIKNSTMDDIKDSMMRSAVEKAADIMVNKYIHDDNDSIMSRANNRLDKEVKELVASRYSEVTKDVSDRLAVQVAKMDDPDNIRRSVRKRAEDILVNRFDNDLDDLKRKAEEAFDDANERYETKLDNAIDRFESKLDDKIEGYSDNLASMKKIYDSIEGAFSRHRGDRDGKEIRFTLG